MIKQELSVPEMKMKECKTEVLNIRVTEREKKYYKNLSSSGVDMPSLIRDLIIRMYSTIESKDA